MTLLRPSRTVNNGEGQHTRRRRPRFTASQREAVRRASKGICRYCGELVLHLIDEHIDHIVPVSRGGKHLFSNWAYSHASCNLKKGARLPTRKERFVP